MNKWQLVAGELVDLGILLLGIGIIIGVTFVGVMFGEWIAGIFYRAGDTSGSASFLAHAVALLLTLGVILSVGGRFLTGMWWWREGQ